MIEKSKIKESWKKFAKSTRAKQLKKFFRRSVIVFIVGIILYQLYDIGWGEVLNNLPTQPLFYLLFFVIYLTLPIAEVFIYRQVWIVKKWEMFKAFLTKRVYNDEVMGYSGEFYLFVWGRKHLQKIDKEILKNVRDNNILSAVSSNLVAVVLVTMLVLTGIIDLEDIIGNVDLIYIIGGGLIAAIGASLIIQFRKYLFDLPLKKALIIFSIYLTRFLIHNGLMILLWAVAIPNTPFSAWFLFVTIMIVVNRIPFLPSRDLVFMMAGIEMSRMLDMTTAAVAGMLLVYSVLKKVINLILFLIISYYSKDPNVTVANKKSTNSIEPDSEGM